MSYKKVLERLRAHQPQALIAGRYSQDDLCCVISAVLPSVRGPSTARIRALYEQSADLRAEVEELGCSISCLELLQRRNDLSERATPSQRYTALLGWLEAQVAKE